MKLTCFLIDDEPLAIDLIQTHLEKISRIEVVGSFQNAIQAFEALQVKPVDLLFLDIQMPGLNGIKLLQSLKYPPQVIFTTAYREYAIDGFDLDATDYLLKPISFERLLKAINKVFTRNQPSSLPRIHSEEKEAVSSLYVQVGKKRVKVELNEILYLESQRDYVKIKTTQKEIVVHQTISYLEEQLPTNLFLRIHRSFIIRLDKIEGWSNTDIDLPGAQLPIGRTYKSQVMKVLEKQSNVL